MRKAAEREVGLEFVRVEDNGTFYLFMNYGSKFYVTICMKGLWCHLMPGTRRNSESYSKEELSDIKKAVLELESWACLMFDDRCTIHYDHYPKLKKVKVEEIENNH